MGLIGGLIGFAPMLALGVELLADPPEAGRALAIVPLVMAAIYVPAVWASLAHTERRRDILRASVIASLVLAFLGSVIFGFALLVLLMPATALLAIAGRLVFSR